MNEWMHKQPQGHIATRDPNLPQGHIANWDPDSAVWPDARALSICGTGFQAVWLPCGLAQPRRGNHSYLLTVTVTGKSPAKAGPLLGP